MSDIKARSRRKFLKNTGASLLASTSMTAPSISRAASRPQLNTGCASGDVTNANAVLWTRTDRPAQLRVTFADNPEFKNSLTYPGGFGLPENDFNTKAVIDGLKPETQYYYRLQAESLESPGLLSETMSGSFRSTSMSSDKPIRFCWSGDTAGQGWGIDRARDGMKIYQAMLSQKPDFFVHRGDQIYADGPIQETVTLDDGSLWRNELIEAKTRVAESSQDFRDNYYYNYLDDHFSRFHAEVPVYYQWDDHEVLNNWYPGEILEDDRYSIKSASLLAARAQRAMFEADLAEKQGKAAKSMAEAERIKRLMVGDSVRATENAMTAATAVITMPTIAKVADNILNEAGWSQAHQSGLPPQPQQPSPEQQQQMQQQQQAMEQPPQEQQPMENPDLAEGGMTPEGMMQPQP